MIESVGGVGLVRLEIPGGVSVTLPRQRAWIDRPKHLPVTERTRSIGGVRRFKCRGVKPEFSLYVENSGALGKSEIDALISVLNTSKSDNVAINLYPAYNDQAEFNDMYQVWCVSEFDVNDLSEKVAAGQTVELGFRCEALLPAIQYYTTPVHAFGRRIMTSDGDYLVTDTGNYLSAD